MRVHVTRAKCLPYFLSTLPIQFYGRIAPNCRYSPLGISDVLYHPGKFYHSQCSIVRHDAALVKCPLYFASTLLTAVLGENCLNQPSSPIGHFPRCLRSNKMLSL